MRTRLAFVLSVSFISVGVFAADPLPRAKPETVGMSSERLARIGEALRADVEKGRLPGAVVAVARKGKLVYYQSFGYLDKDAGTKMQNDAIFSIASMTKPMVAVGALTLLERGQLAIDEPVGTYLPPLSKMQVAVLKANDGGAGFDTVAAQRQVTIQDLMRHTSGIIYGGRGATPVHKLYPASSSAAGTGMTGKEFIDKLGSLPLLHQPGSTWDYGFGLDVLGVVIEKISGQPLGQYLEAQVFKPLGMKDTAFAVPPEKAKRYAKPFANDPDTGKPQFVLDLTKPLRFECGGGCAASTAGDYLRFAQMLLDGGKLEGKRILSRKTVEYMLANQLAPNTVNLIANADPTSADMGFGLGVAVRTTPGIVRKVGSVGEFSWNGAYGTSWWADPKENLAVVFMAQTPGPIRWHYRYVLNALVEQAIVD
ncbi:MAG TPA: serine hydrolase domain-containing protein [Burkholderiales bacterium]|jgi:CubicO group peptidase (beta-lactamase class C family)|nr:serine hydrolase domain-containing protein [Burkholderiales bacterium]